MQERSGWPVARSPRNLRSRPLRRRQGPATQMKTGRPSIHGWPGPQDGHRSSGQLSNPTLSSRLAAAFLWSAILDNGIGIELAVPRDGGIDGDTGAHRIFVVQVRIHMLRLLTNQPFDQFHGVS